MAAASAANDGGGGGSTISPSLLTLDAGTAFEKGSRARGRPAFLIPIQTCDYSTVCNPKSDLIPNPTSSTGALKRGRC